ncbi:WD40 repeat domain-containing protein [Dictyobacter aurantiacus]|uniref:Anaphase-promoting complex subunit 4 WD40 domain-containing protein n=1 Tax=Dictyobacter aurantiacus TaxID=1936993 RepID=A0A401ZS88_9CHLR|nr:WD40 repeat domain-containing protein [Dictyobacter aurantiacus]GCE09713.1 hypothetical protein KDAU_70420 [Dictyobacter aurantiacus]
MTDHNDEFTPEGVDEQLEQHMPVSTNEPLRLMGPEGSADDRLVADLQLMYRQGAPRATSDEDAQSLQNAWQRIKMVAAEKRAERVSPQNERKSMMLHIDKKQNYVPEKRPTLWSRLGVLTAACIAIMVVGSMVLLLNNVNSARQAKTTTHVGAGIAHPHPAVTTTPGFKPTVTNSKVTLSKDVGKNVYTWDAKQYDQAPDSIYALAWSPDSKRIASGSESIDVWDATTGNHYVSLQPYTNGTGASVLAVRWSPDGKYVASTKGGQVQIWNPVTRTVVQTLTYPGVTPVASINNTLPQTSVSSYLGSYQQRSGGTFIYDFAWSPDGAKLVAGAPTPNGTSSLVIWNMTTLQTTTLVGHTGQVAHVTWSPDGKYIASSAYDSTVRIWDATTGKNVYTRNAPDSYDAASLAWSPTKGDERLLVGYTSGSIEIFDALNGRYALKYSVSMNSYLSAVAWSPDGKVVAAAGDGVLLLDAHKDALLYTYTGNANPIRSMAWSPNGKYIAIGDNMSEAGAATIDVKVWIAQ